VARNGILNMMSSSERCRQFQQTIMNPLYSPAIHENLLRNLRSYLDQIKRQLPVPTLLQVITATLTHVHNVHNAYTCTYTCTCVHVRIQRRSTSVKYYVVYKNYIVYLT
jgi:hypothetical protein